jgi:drug/metabolite transporter (DMT)-like permease
MSAVTPGRGGGAFVQRSTPAVSAPSTGNSFDAASEDLTALALATMSTMDLEGTTASHQQELSTNDSQSKPLEISSTSSKATSWWMPTKILDSPSVQTGRMLVLLAAALYGSNFATVKLLDDAMPLSISATLRFGLASAVVSSIVLSQESDDVDPVVVKERNAAFWGGAEIGLWYCIGYILQAEGLQTVDAGKVRTVLFYCNLLLQAFFGR